VKSTICLIAVLVLCFGSAGCNKNPVSGTAKTPEEASFQLRMSLEKASPDLRKLYDDKVDPGVRYDRYPQALAALDQMANDPSIKPDQKKLITQLADMLKPKAPSP
jgi:hypothetical protein